MKFHIPDKHLTISNILMALTLVGFFGGTIGVIFQQVLMTVVTIAVLAAFALAIYAIVLTIVQSGGVVVRYEEHDQTVHHIHTVRHIHTLEQQQPQQRLTVLPQQPTLLQRQPQQLPVERKRIEVKR